MTDAHAFEQNPDGLPGLDCRHCPLPEAHPSHLAPPLPDLPYAGTSGWSGSETSQERAVEADADGTTSERQATVLAALAEAGTHGATWREVAGAYGWHHGQASGVLSVLHKTGRIARLTVRRNRCQVYVLPEHVGDRETAEHGRDRLTPHERAVLDRAESLLGFSLVPPVAEIRLLVEALRRLAG